MSAGFNKRPSKYLVIELLFFLVFLYLFPILTDLEYMLTERQFAPHFIDDMKYRMVYGCFELPAYYLFYIIIQKYALKKRAFTFLLVTLLFLIAYNIYFSFVYYFVGHTPFFPKQVHSQALALSQQKGRVAISVVYTLYKFISISALAYFVQSSRQDEQMKELKQQQVMAELSYLKAQLHPHFFFNTMNNIYSLALKQSADTAPLVAKLAEMMRYILYEADRDEVGLDREIGFLTNYIEAEQVRHGNGTQIVFDVQGRIDNTFIAPLLLLPFIENAFKHGLEHETAAGFVTIILCRTEYDLVLEVSNSKPQIKEAIAAKGIGLQNAVKRLDLLYPAKYELDIKEDEDNYNVNLTLRIA